MSTQVNHVTHLLLINPRKSGTGNLNIVLYFIHSRTETEILATATTSQYNQDSGSSPSLWRAWFPFRVVMVDQHSLKLALPLQHLPLFTGVLNALRWPWFLNRKEKKDAMAGAGLLWEKSTVGWLVTAGWCWFDVRKKYCWLDAANSTIECACWILAKAVVF